MVRTDVCCLREIQHITVQLYPRQQAVGEQSRNGNYSYTCFFCSSICILGLKVTRRLIKKNTIMSCPYWQGQLHTLSQRINVWKNMYFGVGQWKYDIFLLAFKFLFSPSPFRSKGWVTLQPFYSTSLSILYFCICICLVILYIRFMLFMHSILMQCKLKYKITHLIFHFKRTSLRQTPWIQLWDTLTLSLRGMEGHLKKLEDD